MSEHGNSMETDKGIGFAVLLSLLAVAGAAVMYLNAGTEMAGWGFAAAMLAGTLAVAGIHLYWN